MENFVYLVVREEHGEVSYGIDESSYLVGAYNSFKPAINHCARILEMTPDKLYVHDCQVCGKVCGRQVVLPDLDNDSYTYSVSLIKVPVGSDKPMRVFLGGGFYVE